MFTTTEPSSLPTGHWSSMAPLKIGEPLPIMERLPTTVTTPSRITEPSVPPGEPLRTTEPSAIAVVPLPEEPLRTIVAAASTPT